MATSDSFNYDLIDRLAEEFAERYRRGERPALQEFIDRHPDQAEAIRELLPAMVQMEQAKEEVVAEPAPSPPPLERLGDFRILREIGHGGMGIVYEAEQESLGRRVALKILPKKMLLDAKQKRRFEREAKAAAKLHHTNIVPVFGVFEHDGMPYYVMQYIQGQGFDQVLEELRRIQSTGQQSNALASSPAAPAAHVAHSLLTGEFEPTLDADAASSDSPAVVTDSSFSLNKSSASLTLSGSSVALPGQKSLSQSGKRGNVSYWHSVAHIGVQVASALEYAHKQGIVHRDIKPSNLLLDTQHTVWVTDFGLAKADDQQNLTHTGDILGTLRYMPPEAFEGKTDARSDVYALGLTLYEMLVLSPAYGEREKHKLIKQVTTEDAPRLERLNPAIPRDLVTIVHKAMDREPQAHYSSAGELQADLQRFIDDEPIHARRISVFERLSRWARHNRGVAASLAATFLVVLVGLGLVTWKWQAERKARGDAKTALDQSEKLAEENRQQTVRLSAANDRLEAGRNYLREGAFAKARDEFTEAIRLHPENSSGWNERGQLYCQLGLWERAAPDILRAFELQPPSERFRTRFRDAFFRLQSGDLAGYRRVCNDMLRELRHDDRTENAFWAVFSAGLSANAVDDPKQLVRAAQQHLRHYPRNAMGLFQLALAQYRAGQLGEALHTLQEAGQQFGNQNPMVQVLLAMTHHRRGEGAEALRVLVGIGKTIGQLVWEADPRGFLKSNEGETWEGRAVIEELTSEAMELIVKTRQHHTLAHVVRARAYVELNEADGAGEEYGKAAALEPKNERVRNERFRFFAAQKSWDKAEDELAAIAAVKPNDVQVHLEAFRVYANAGAWDKAKAQHAKAMQMRPEDRRIALEHMRYHLNRGEMKEADAAFAEQWAQRPNDVELRIESAKLHFYVKCWDSALADYAKVIELRPDDVWTAWYPYALLCLRTGDLPEYRQVCRQLFKRFENTNNRTLAGHLSIICKLAPDAVGDPARLVAFARDHQIINPGVLGHCYFRSGQYREALDHLTKSVGTVQTYSHIWDKYFLAMTCQKLGMHGDASRWLADANRSRGNESEFAMRVGWEWHRLDVELLREEAEKLIVAANEKRREIDRLIANSQWQAAHDRLDELFKNEQGAYVDWMSRGRCFAGLKQWDKMAAAYKEAIAAGAKGVDVWYQVGYAHVQRQEWKEALAALERGVGVDPSNRGVWHLQAVAYHGLKQYEQALAAADRALAMGDKSTWLPYHRAGALIGLNRLDEAITDLNPLIQSVKDNTGPLRRRGECYVLKKQWREALADFTEASKLQPDDSANWYAIAAAHLGAGQLEEYRKACRKMQERFADGEPAHVSRTVYINVALPDTFADKDLLVRFAERAAELFPGNERVLGAALVRAGKYAEAIKQFDKAELNFPRRAWDWILLAMAHHHLKNAVEARKCLANADEWFSLATKKPSAAVDSKHTWIAWSEQVEVEHLRREAKSLIGK